MTGASLSLLPAMGPIGAAVLLLARGLRLRRGDGLWATAAALFAAPALARGEPVAALVAAGTVVGPWIVYRTFTELGRTGTDDPAGVPAAVSTLPVRAPLAAGLLVGLAGVVIGGFLNAVEGLQFGVSRTVAHAILWDASPALYGHTVLVVGGMIALVTATRRGVAWTALFLAALGILVSGSLEAAVAWIVLALAFLLLRPPGERRPRLAEAVLLAAMIGLSAGLAPLLGWGRLGFTLNDAATQRTGVNLFAGTEVPYADAWDDRWVDVTTEPVALAGAPYTAYAVTKRGAPGWYRLQQLVRLEPGATYTLSGWIDATGPTHPGFQGWGAPPDRAANDGDAAAPFVLISTWTDAGWSASVQGPGRLEGARVLDADGPWRRVAATFRYQGADPLTWFVGFTPDARSEAGTTSRMAGLQLERSASATPYVPGPAQTGLTFDYARAPLWSVALRMGGERPLAGWGPDAFAERYALERPDAAQRTLVPDHPHNQPLRIWVEGGALGLAGLALLLTALLGPAVRARDLGLVAVAGAALAVNLFDATLLSGAVLYPLAAGAGWRRGRAPRRIEGASPGAPPSDGTPHDAPPDADPQDADRTSTYEDGPRALLVRLSLAATDLAVAGVGLAVASRVADGALPALDGPLPWLLLLWPAFALREGLYPGYGLTDADQLQRQVRGWAFATAAYALLARLAGPDLLPTSPLALVLVAVTTLALTPPARALAKRALLHLGVWGRPVLLVGAGATGARVARALDASPLDGLHPVAAFDDDPALHGTTLGTVPVVGPLDAVEPHARTHGIRHAVVTPDTLHPRVRDDLVTGASKTFDVVQFVPTLDGLPSRDVRVSDLDGLLALEVRIGLSSPTNRALKRTFDVVATTLGGLLITPLLLALALLVRTSGPGPILYGQRRIGRHGRPFTIWKFRTMVPDADAVLETHLHNNPHLRAEWDADHKLRNDPRITPIGALLRRTSLDELPQLWNVLTGDMSLVGPRPITKDERPKYHDAFALYARVRPGITGVWQVSGRNDTTYQERVTLDAHYVRNWNLWIDLVTLWKTVDVVLNNEGV